MNGENIDKNVLFKRADTALYKSKINGRNRPRVLIQYLLLNYVHI